MNGFLVFSVHNLDDIPLEMFATQEEALRAAHTHPPAESNPLGTMDSSGFIGMKVLEIREGKPVPDAIFVERQDV